MTGDGHRQLVDYPQASNPGIDCFHLYPRITLQATPNATLAIDPQESAIAELEASRDYVAHYNDGRGVVLRATPRVPTCSPSSSPRRSTATPAAPPCRG